MSNTIIEIITPYLVDIGKIAIYICLVGFVFGLAKNAILKGDLRL